MTREEFKEALKSIKKECDKHKNCVDCPLSDEDYHNFICFFTYNPNPWEWKLY